MADIKNRLARIREIDRLLYNSATRLLPTTQAKKKDQEMTNNFIVTLKKNTPDVETKKFVDSVHRAGGSIVHEFDIIKGYTIKLPDVLHLKNLKEKHSNVIENVEEDKEVHTN